MTQYIPTNFILKALIYALSMKYVKSIINVDFDTGAV